MSVDNTDDVQKNHQLKHLNYHLVLQYLWLRQYHQLILKNHDFKLLLLLYLPQFKLKELRQRLHLPVVLEYL